MEIRKTLTFIMLAAGLIIAPSAWTQEKPFTEQQVLDMVRAGLGNDEGAKLILQRGIDFEPTSGFLKRLKSAGAKDAFVKSLRANEPFTQEEVSHMVNAGLGEESGAQTITQRGIDFSPSENYMQALKDAGAKDVFLKAVRDRSPLNQVQVVAYLAADSPSPSVAALVKDRGVSFAVKDDYLEEVHLAGGDDELIAALKNAKVKVPATADTESESKPNKMKQLMGHGSDLKGAGIKAPDLSGPGVKAPDLSGANLKGGKAKEPATTDAAAQTGLDQIAQHVAHGAELKLKGQYADAEKEFHEALTLGPSFPDVCLALALVEGQQKKWDDELTAGRDALRLNPDNEKAHILIGVALGGKGDWDGAEAEYREVIRLNSKSDVAHAYLGVALGGKKDWTGEITEEREALRLNPKNDFARANLGAALGNKGDWDGAVAEYHKALDLNPQNDTAHCNLAAALGNKGDWDGAIAEYREALRLNPSNDVAHAGLSAALGSKGNWEGAVVEDREMLRSNPNDDRGHVNLADALRNNGDWDGAIAEYHVALKLNPNNELAHAGLGITLGAKGDLDGKISEEREALRLNPNDASVHASLGDALEQKGDRQGAQDEYHTAANLDPKNANYKQNYERLLQEVRR